MSNIKNIAIIAHVDHGKTTIIDEMLKQSGTFRDNQQVNDRVMDSNDLEKERGITILAKCTSLQWKDCRINVVDTPGHADFGGEVERILSMVDGVVLLVDSSEGVMPQTKFVLSKALKLGLVPIVVINKIDRPDKRIAEVEDEILELFMTLEASDEQLEFTTLYAVGRDGWATKDPNVKTENLHALFDTIIDKVPYAKITTGDHFSFLGTILQYDNFFGRLLTGKVYSGKVKVGMQAKGIDVNGNVVEKSKITKLFTYNGITREPVEEVQAGDICVIAGFSKATVSNTICSEEITQPIPSTEIDPPTISITIFPNTSPLSGRDGSKVTSTVIKERLIKESESNIAIKVKESEDKESFEVSGRGELQLGVLIETMRREGFELSVSKPNVIFKEENGKKLEPIEEVVIDVDEQYSSGVLNALNLRKGIMVDMKQGLGKTRIIYHVPSRGLIGYQSEFLVNTRGTGVMNRLFHSYQEFRGDMNTYKNGALISTEAGKSTGYAIFQLQDRGVFFINPQDEVYQGMIVGEHNRENDLDINVVKGKQLTNVRASGSDEAIKIIPAKKMTLEDMISYIREDELIEVTPNFLRMRKRFLNPNDRKRKK